MEGLQYKLCAKCKRLIPKSTKGWYCEDCKKSNNKEYSDYNNRNSYAKAREVYDSTKWKKVRTSYRKANPICEICTEMGRHGVLSMGVHHIIKVKYGNDESNYDEANLISVCNSCHKKIEGMNRNQLIEALMDGSL